MKVSRFSLSSFFLFSFLLIFTVSANATLVDNLDGTVIQTRNNGSQPMWLQDANTPNTSEYCFTVGNYYNSIGFMTWFQTKNEFSDSNNSDITTGISQEEDRLIPPIPPGNVRAHTFEKFIELSWLGTGSDIAVNYKIYRRIISVKDLKVIANIPVQNNNRKEYIFHDSSVKEALFYEYAVTVVDRYGNESSYSKTVKVKVNH